jgi:hypothetical protein
MLEKMVVVETEEVSPAVAMLMETIDVIKERQAKYGSPLDHWTRTVGMINAAFGSVLRRPLTVEEWGLIMMLDKVARYLGPGKTLDGPIDMAGYAACIAQVEATK